MSFFLEPRTASLKDWQQLADNLIGELLSLNQGYQKAIDEGSSSQIRENLRNKMNEIHDRIKYLKTTVTKEGSDKYSETGKAAQNADGTLNRKEPSTIKRLEKVYTFLEHL